MSRTSIILFFSLLVLLPAACTRDEPAPDCMIDEGACTKFVDDTTVTLDVAPRPVRAMQELKFSVQLARGTAPVRHAEVVVDLTMPGMNMGENKVRLRGAGDGTYRGTGIIVRCSSGKTLWKASVVVTEGRRILTAGFLFDAP